MISWTPEEDEAFNEVEKLSNLGKEILRNIKTPRVWQGLTGYETAQLLDNACNQLDANVFVVFAEAIEAKLKEKNT